MDKINLEDYDILDINDIEEINEEMDIIGIETDNNTYFINLDGLTVLSHNCDGVGSILPLICNFFYKYWPELFQGDDPFIRAFMTPFIIADKGKERKYWYLNDLSDFDKFDSKGWNITRAKGLGSLSTIDLKNVINDIRCIPIYDNGNLGNFLRLAFDNNMSNNRKYWLTVDGEDFKEAVLKDMKWVKANNE